MMPISLPALRPSTWPGVFVEQAELAGAPIWAITVRDNLAGSIRRRWCATEREAIAWAAGQADTMGLGLFDLTDPADHP